MSKIDAEEKKTKKGGKHLTQHIYTYNINRYQMGGGQRQGGRIMSNTTEQHITDLKELGRHMSEQLDKINGWKGGRDHAAELWFKPREFGAMGIRAMREEDNMGKKDFEQFVLGRRTTIAPETLAELAERAAELAEDYEL